MHRKQRVAEMADEVLVRRAKIHAARTGDPLEEAPGAVMGTQAGRQLGELRDGPHHDERVQEWREGLAWVRAEERADAPGWSSSAETMSSLTEVPRRGPR